MLAKVVFCSRNTSLFSCDNPSFFICSTLKLIRRSHQNRIGYRLTNLMIAQLTPMMYNPAALNLSGTFTVFCVCCLLMTLWVSVFVPETKGYSLEDMDLVFANHTEVPNTYYLSLEPGSPMLCLLLCTFVSDLPVLPLVWTELCLYHTT